MNHALMLQQVSLLLGFTFTIIITITIIIAIANFTTGYLEKLDATPVTKKPGMLFRSSALPKKQVNIASCHEAAQKKLPNNAMAAF